MTLLMTNREGKDIVIELDLQQGNYRYGMQTCAHGEISDLLAALDINRWPDSVMEEFGTFLNRENGSFAGGGSMSEVNMWEIEDGFFSDDVKVICGVDEAGRGPLAGPVCAAAVILPPHLEIPGLTDSKKLTDKKRRELFPLIQEQAIAWGIGWASEKEIDEINILQATFLAMQRAMDQLSVKPDLALIDGNRERDFGVPVKTVVKGDSLSMNIAAASILAKVSRDDVMVKLAESYPQYQFEVHKGYGTKAHYAALTEHGSSPVHRMSFLKKFYGEK